MWTKIREARHFEPAAVILLLAAVLGGALWVYRQTPHAAAPVAVAAPADPIIAMLATLSLVLTIGVVLLGAATVAMWGEIKRVREDTARTLKVLERSVGGDRRFDRAA